MLALVNDNIPLSFATGEILMKHHWGCRVLFLPLGLRPGFHRGHHVLQELWTGKQYAHRNKTRLRETDW